MEAPDETLETISYHYIEPSELFDGEFYGGFDILLIRHIGFDG